MSTNSSAPKKGRAAAPSHPCAVAEPAALQQALKGVNQLLDKQSALHDAIQALRKNNPMSDEMKDPNAAFAQVAATIQIVVNHIQAADDSRLAATRDNYTKLQEQRSEVIDQRHTLPDDALEEANSKIMAEIESLDS